MDHSPWGHEELDTEHAWKHTYSIGTAAADLLCPHVAKNSAFALVAIA